MLHTVRFLCSVVAAFARLVRELRKASSIAMACAACSPVLCVHAVVAVAAPPAGLVSAARLAPRRKVCGAATAPGAVQKQLVVVAPPPVLVVAAAPSNNVVGSGSDDVEQKAENKRKKTAWSESRRPSRLVIPVADDAGEVAAGWGAAAAPVKEVNVEVEGEDFCVASRAGPRHAMEDAYSVVTHKNDGDSQLAFYGVFDGHGGRAAVDFVSERLGKNVVSAVLAAGTETRREASLAEEDAVSAAIRAAYLATDSELLAQYQDVISGGACATTALVKNADLYVAHLGDCRAVLSHNGGAAVALTADHTCAREDERERIERDGGYVSRSGSGVWRVQGSLAVSRSFGDVGLKRWVVAEPAVARVPLSAGCEFLVIASDGLWDKVTNQEAVDAVSRSSATACGELVELARRRGSRDDVTVMVVDLERFVR